MAPRHGRGSATEQILRRKKTENAAKKAAKSDPKRAMNNLAQQLFEEAHKKGILKTAGHKKNDKTRSYIVNTNLNKIEVEQVLSNKYNLFINDECKGEFTKQEIIDEVKALWKS